MSKSLTPDDNCNTCQHGRRSTVTVTNLNFPVVMQVVHCKKNIQDSQAHPSLRKVGANRPEFRCLKFKSRDPRRRP